MDWWLDGVWWVDEQVDEWRDKRMHGLVEESVIGEIDDWPLAECDSFC